jgi:hypothetical protein
MRLTAMFRKRWVAGSVSRAGLGVVAALVLGAGLAGCGGGGSAPPPPPCADGTIQVQWDFLPGFSCQAGDVVVVRVDNNNMLATFDCTAFGGVTPGVAGGVTHTVDLTLFDGSNPRNVVEQSPVINVPVDCGGQSTTPVYDFSS